MKHLLLFLAIALCYATRAQNVGVGTTSPAAKLDISSTNSGILIPRVALTSTAAASPVTSPATSTMVYNTATAGSGGTAVTPGFYYWNGTAWLRIMDQTITGATGSTGPTGAAGTNGTNGTNGATGAAGTNGTNGSAGATGPTGLLSNGSAAGNTPYWNGSSWVVNSSNIYNNGGNVGVGTASPNSKLAVVGRGIFGDNSLTNNDANDDLYLEKVGMFTQMHLYNADGSNPDINAYISENTTGTPNGSGNTNPGLNIWTSSAHPIRFSTNTTERMTILSSGNVGIGTANPANKLEVAGNTKTTNFQMTTGATAGYILTSDASGNASWGSTSGLVGPTGPTGAAGTNGSNGATGAAGTNGTNGTNGTTGATGAAGTNGTNGTAGATGPTGLLSNGSAAGNTPYWNGSSWVVNSSNIFNNGGNVGIGTASPAGPLHIANADYYYGGLILDDPYGSDIGASLQFRNSNAGAHNYYIIGSTGTNAGAGAGAFAIFDQTVSTYRFVINGSGNVGIGTSTPQNKLDVAGSLAVGSYAGTNAAPSNGIIVSGNVGVGTLDTGTVYPENASRLYINGPVQTTNLSASVLKVEQQYVDMGGTNDVGPGIMLNVNNAYNNWNTGAITGTVGTPGSNLGFPGGLAFWTKPADGSTTSAPVEQMRLTSSGYLGIGTSSPSSTLQVAGKTTTTNFQMTNGATAGYVLASDASGNGTWTSTTSLVGPTGPTGPTGAAGTNGTNGAAGATGPTGAAGTNGSNGTNGTTGPTGAAGTNGTNGATGATGAAGTNGTNGTAGATGPTGAAGTNGTAGATGPTGAAGTNGTNGTAGATGPTGLLSGGSAAGNTPYWNGSSWVVNSSNIYNNGGNVGVNNTSPASSLDVNGAMRVEGAQTTHSQGVQIEWNKDGSTGQSWILNQEGLGTGGIVFGEVTTGNTVTQNMVITGTGNVGIGTTSPSSTLQVAGKTTTTNFQMTSGATAGYVLASDASGNGTWTSTSSLVGPTGPTGAAGSNGSAGATGPTGLLSSGSAAGNTPYWNGSSWVVNSSNIYNNGGNVGIGTASPNGALAVVGKGVFGDNTVSLVDANDNLYLERVGSYTQMHIYNNDGSNTDINAYLSENTTGTNSGFGNTAPGVNLWTASAHPIRIATNATERLTILANGNMGVSNTAPTHTLDVGGVINTTSGYQIGGAATSGSYLRGNGTSFVSGTIQASDLSAAISGTSGYHAKFTGANTIGNSLVYDNGSAVSVGTTSVAATFNVNGNAVIGTTGLNSRSGNGLTVDFTSNTAFAANTDATDALRSLNIVNESGTANSMAILAMRSNSGGGANNQMLDMKLVNPNDGTSKLIYSFGPNASFTDRFAFTSAGNMGIGTTSPSLKLDVEADANIYSPVMKVQTTGTNSSGSPTLVSSAIGFYNQSGTQNGWIGTNGTNSSNALIGGANGMQIYASNGNNITLGDDDGGVHIFYNGSTNNLGLGTASPAYPLDVENTSGTFSGNFAFYSISGTSPFTGSGSGGGSVSIYAAGRMIASEFDSKSDRRIKDVVGISNSESDLATIGGIEVTDFKYYDKLEYGDKVKKGFIAQQVETVFPEAVSKTVNFIPNIYALSKTAQYNASTQQLTVVLDKAHGLAVGDKVKIITERGKKEVDVTAINSAMSVTVSGWDENTASVFVYGKEVNDFRVVDYDRIYTLNVSATQELARRLLAAEAKNENLENTVNTLKTAKADASAIDQLKAEIELLKTAISTSNK